MKTAEIKLADLIQSDQFQTSTANGLDALRSALTAQLAGAVMAPSVSVPGAPAGVQQITIGLPSTQSQPSTLIDIPKLDPDASKQQPMTSQFVNISQLQALISALAGVRGVQPPKDPLNDVITSHMFLQSQPALVTSSASTPASAPSVATTVDGLNTNPISFSNAGLALASALSPPGTTNAFKGITLPSGDCELEGM